CRTWVSTGASTSATPRSRSCSASCSGADVRRLLLVTLLALAAAAADAAAAAKVDVVVLKNGSRIVGEIKQMAKSRLELGTDDMGTLQIEWDNIKEITAPEYFEIEHMNGGL